MSGSPSRAPPAVGAPTVPRGTPSMQTRHWRFDRHPQTQAPPASGQTPRNGNACQLEKQLAYTGPAVTSRLQLETAYLVYNDSLYQTTEKWGGKIMQFFFFIYIYVYMFYVYIYMYNFCFRPTAAWRERNHLGEMQGCGARCGRRHHSLGGLRPALPTGPGTVA